MMIASWVRSSRLVLALLAGLAVCDASGIDEIAGLASAQTGARFVKRFRAPAGSVIVGIEFVNNDDRIVFPKVALLQGPADRLCDATLIAEAVNVRATAAHRVRLSVPPVAVASSQEFLVAVSFPPSARVRGPGEGAGIGATRLAAPGNCYVAPTAEETFHAIDVDLGIALVFRGAGKVAPGSGEEREATVDFLSGTNPSSKRTRIEFGVEKAGPVRLGIYDVAGREVRRLADGHHEAGVHSLDWDGRNGDGVDVAAGVYFARLHVGDKSLTQKIVLAK